MAQTTFGCVCWVLADWSFSPVLLLALHLLLGGERGALGLCSTLWLPLLRSRPFGGSAWVLPPSSIPFCHLTVRALLVPLTLGYRVLASCHGPCPTVFLWVGRVVGCFGLPVVPNGRLAPWGRAMSINTQFYLCYRARFDCQSSSSTGCSCHAFEGSVTGEPSFC